MALLIGLAVPASAQTAPLAFILDADTANEMDDMYAITQALLDQRAAPIALSSAHFNNVEIFVRKRWHHYDMAGFVTVEASQRENERLLGLLGSTIPAPMGARDIIGFSWGYFDGAPIPQAPAIDFIIARARTASPEHKLAVVMLGPLTNVAAALIKAPDIAPRIHVYALGAKYDVASGVWDKNEFNIRNDLNAADYMLNRDDVALTILPATVAAGLKFDRTDTLARLARSPRAVAPVLAGRWDFVDAGASWTMWDLALTLAVTHPELATFETRAAPPENRRRTLEVITAIDAPGMRQAFWSVFGA
ncbi:MAG: nucleoside hydrolase [Sphingomonas sp.]